MSTDYTTSDKLYFEPLTIEDVMNIVTLEKPEGVVVSLGGQTAINLADKLHEMGVKIIGTGVEAINRAPQGPEAASRPPDWQLQHLTLAMPELLSRIRALIRRPPAIRGGETLCFEDLSLNPSQCKLVCGKNAQTLSRKEREPPGAVFGEGNNSQLPQHLIPKIIQRQQQQITRRRQRQTQHHPRSCRHFS